MSLALLSAACPAAASGDSYVGPLDLVPGAIAAYSAAWALSSAARGGIVAVVGGSNVTSDATTGAVTGGSGTVSSLKDQSGNSSHALQTTAGQRPTWAATGFDGKPSLSFDSSAQNILLTAGDVTTFTNGGITVFVVCQITYDGSHGSQGLLGQNYNAQSGDGADLGVYIAALNNPGANSMRIEGQDADFNDGAGAFSTTALTLSDIPLLLQFSSQVSATSLLHNGVSAAIGSDRAYGTAVGPIVRPLSIGNYDGASPSANAYLNGLLSELLIYPLLSSPDASAIAQNIAARYPGSITLP